MERCVVEIVNGIASEYNFDADDCIKKLLSRPSSSSSKSSSSKSSKSKSLVPLPFLREQVCESGCQGILFNHGLFTQCKNVRSSEAMCDTCSVENCGTVEGRMMEDFKDPKGRSPSSYISVLRKLKLTREDAETEAGKVNIELNDSHFVEQVKAIKEPKVKVVKEKVIKEKVIKEKPVKEPKVIKEKVIKEKVIKEKVIKEKVIKEPKVIKEKVIKEKVVKEKVIKEPKVIKEKVGRPKSSKKATETVTVEDLFASLVADEQS